MQKAIDLFLNIYFGQKNKYNFFKNVRKVCLVEKALEDLRGLFKW